MRYPPVPPGVRLKAVTGGDYCRPPVSDSETGAASKDQSIRGVMMLILKGKLVIYCRVEYSLLPGRIQFAAG